MTEKQPLAITDVVLRDAHQSLFATRLRIEDMLPIAAKLDQVGYWSLETWGGATFDACIRYLGEDPWERLRQLKAVMPNTRQQMLLRGQNILGYRHYADDVVERFVERAAATGMDVFRIFDAMNDLRNLETAIKATIRTGKHAQGTLSYTTSPVHNLNYWLNMASRLQDMGCHSICIKDMAGLLKPYEAEELVGHLKERISVPLTLHAHATTGLSTAAIIKGVEAGLDMVDTSISSMSMTYGHTSTETVVAMFQDTPRDTGLNLELLEEIAAYFREVRKKYARFEGALKGTDSRILVAQVPGGMLTNMENQLREQGASERLDEVLQEIPRVREDLGYIPLVTPTSQIVGTQAVINVISGDRYKTITKETEGVLKGEYGATPAPVNQSLRMRVLAEDQKPIEVRPADLLQPEFDHLQQSLQEEARKGGFSLDRAHLENDTLTYALFPQIGLKFLKNRGNPDAFEAPPGADDGKVTAAQKDPSGGVVQVPASPAAYQVEVNGVAYQVRVSPGGEVAAIAASTSSPATVTAPASGAGEAVPAPLSGNIFSVEVAVNQQVNEGDVLLVLEAMKMETEVRAPRSGIVLSVQVKDGDTVHAGDPLLTLG